MEIIKVKELYKMLGAEIENGNGDKELYLTTDDEGNDYRPMYFALTSEPGTIKDFMLSTCSGLNNCKDVNNAILLG